MSATLADAGLGQADQVARGGEAPGVGHRREAAQEVGIEIDTGHGDP
jgi:hypothetical protein